VSFLELRGAMLTEALLNRIAADPHMGSQFVSLFTPFRVEEGPMFLLAVSRYRNNPTWDSCLSVYHMHVSEKSRLMANFSGPHKSDIERYVKSRGDTQKAFAGHGINMHYGPADAHVFDGAFRDVLSELDKQVTVDTRQRAAVETFLENYHLTP
jgi:hypothetical protein